MKFVALVRDIPLLSVKMKVKYWKIYKFVYLGGRDRKIGVFSRFFEIRNFITKIEMNVRLIVDNFSKKEIRKIKFSTVFGTNILIDTHNHFRFRFYCLFALIYQKLISAYPFRFRIC